MNEIDECRSKKIAVFLRRAWAEGERPERVAHILAGPFAEDLVEWVEDVFATYDRYHEREEAEAMDTYRMVLDEEDFKELVAGRVVEITDARGTLTGAQVTMQIILSDIGFDRMLDAVRRAVADAATKEG